MLGIGRLGMFGNGAAGYFGGERGIAFRTAGEKPHRRARAQPLDSGANDGGIGTRSAVPMIVETKLM